MVFKELEIQGFKSFPDKVKIRFDEGVTGVVGPNGSGKSNLSDAVRWVLGETSSRQLRAAGKMEDVIFGGTRRRGAMGFAMVRLTLDNSAHTLDIDADEAVIGRKYYRSGESEYTINGQLCRLKDIYELLLDTGIGRDGYSVIGQGRIAEIVAAKSSERREIFEEACGIAKYRYRKNEAERRLAAAAENLERLRDILDELEARVGPLEKESEKARRFLELSARRKTLEVTLWTDGVHRAREAVRRQVRDYETAQAEYERFDREARAAEAEAEKIRMQAQQLTIAVERLNGDIRSITEELSGSDSRIAVLENDIARNEESAAALREDIATGEQDSTEAAAALERHRAVARSMAAAGEKLAAELAELDAELLRLTSENNASGARRDILRAEVADLTAKRTEAQVAKAAAEAAAQAAQEQLPTLAENTEALEAQRDEAKQDLADTIEYRKMLAENEKQLANVKAGVELKLKGRRTALNEADAAEQKLGRELDAARQRLGVLKELEKNMDGYQNSVKTVMRAASARRLRGIIGPVSSILSVEPGREVAIETALGGALQNIVVENEAAAKAGIALLRSENAGRATFLPLDTVQPGFFRGSLSGSARLASSLVKADPRYANIVSNLLGRIVVVDDINEASRVARELGYHNKVVTLDGQVINAGGSFTGGSVQRSAGLFTRKQEMEELRVRTARLQKDCLAAQDRTDELKTQVDALAAELTATESEIITAANDRIRAEAEQKRLEAAVEQSEAALAGRQDEMERRKAQLDAARARAEDAAKQEEALAADIETRTAELERIAEGDDAFLAQQRSLAERLSAKRMEQLARQKDAELARSQIEALEKQARDAESRRAVLEESLTALAARSGACQEEIEAIRRAKTDSTALIAAKEAEIREATEKRLLCQKDETEALAKGRAAADEREEMGREMARLAERKAAAEGEYDQMAAKLWDEYQLTLSQAEELCVEFENVNVLRAQVADLRGKIRALGNVNVSAIEEYQEVKARYDTLRAQVEDVEGSRNELTRMITSLSGQMKDIFTDSFRAINENFGRVFTELFGGGEASLVLEDESDVLSCGIEIKVQPPGKALKTITLLSGGEKGLAAIALLLSIAYYFIIRRMGALKYTDGFAGIFSGIVIVACFTAGAQFVTWMGNQIDAKGIGNGLSLMIFAGIVADWSRVGSSFQNMLTRAQAGASGYYIMIPAMVILALVAVVFVVILTNAERRIPVQYAKRVVGRKMYGGQASYIPIKVNMSGVMPIIFASTLCGLPNMIGSFLNLDATKHPYWTAFFRVFNYNSVLYLVVYVLLIVAFNYFYVAIQYNPVDISNQLRKNNGTIPGIRPGKPTSDFITKTLSKITLIGAVFLAIVAAVPMIIGDLTGVSIQLGGTSLLIIVGVALDTARSLEGYMTARHHKGFLE